MNYRLALGAALLLAACSGNPMADAEEGGSGGTATDNPVPEALAGNMQSVGYDAASKTLSVSIDQLDAPTDPKQYERRIGLDTPGYTGFRYQDDALDRMFVGLAKQSADGSVQAVVVGDGGQFGEYYSGATYKRKSGGVPAGATGLVSYAGKYAGITNLDASGKHLKPVKVGTPDELKPSEPARTTGDVFLNVDFSKSSPTVNGAVINRRFVEGGALGAQYLGAAKIDENGEFSGKSVMRDGDALVETGSYGGIIGGKNGAAIAGVVSLDNIFESDDPREDVTGNFEKERGIFVLPRCNQPNAPKALCDQVRP